MSEHDAWYPGDPPEEKHRDEIAVAAAEVTAGQMVAILEAITNDPLVHGVKHIMQFGGHMDMYLAGALSPQRHLMRACYSRYAMWGCEVSEDVDIGFVRLVRRVAL